MSSGYIDIPVEGGAGGIASINGNSAAAQIIAAGTGISVASAGGTTTISSAGGGGSVTSVSVTTANGVSGTVATATTTPAISLSLGAITPTSVAASGPVTGSNLSGTNTGDQIVAAGTGISVSTVGATTTVTNTSPSSGGTVTSTSVVTANGVSGTVATATTTPAITLTLGDITPTSVVASGIISGSNFSGSSSGTNTGDQTITLTGDVAGSGTGSFAATIQANAVTNAKLAQMPANTIKGNNTGSTATALDLTATQTTAMLNSVVGDSGSGGTKGLVPAAASGSYITGTNYLNANGSFTAVDVSKPRPAPFTLFTQTPGAAGSLKYEDVTIAGNYAYVAAAGPNATMAIYDIANPKIPVLKSTTVNLGSYRIAVQGNYAYVPSSGGSTLFIYNITNPNTPSLTGSVAISGAPGSLYSCVVSGNYCYISTQNKGLTVVDVTTPATPVQVFQEGGTLNKSFGIAITGTTVYTTNYQTSAPWTVRYLKTWDVTTPTTPNLTSTYTLPAGTKPLQITLSGNTAFISDGNTNSIQIVDVTTPTAPNYLSSMAATYTFNSSFAAKISGNYAYIPSGSNVTNGGAIDMYDISTLSAPIKVNTVFSGQASSVFGGISINGGYIYVADYYTGSNSQLDVFTLPSEIATFGQITTSGITVKGLSTLANAHLKSTQTTAPTILVNANAGTGASASIAHATDVAGQITIATGTVGLSTGSYATLTFNKAYGVAPIILLTPAGSTLSTSVYVTSTTATFDINFAVAGGISSTYVLNYFIIETQ